MRVAQRTFLGAVCGVALVLAAACNDNDLGIEKRHANQSPVTVLSSGPPDSTYTAHYRVHLFWSGSDADGTIDHYDYILVDHPAIDDSIAVAGDDSTHEVVVRVPLPDDPRWSSTTSNDTIIVTRADTLRMDPAPPPGAGATEIEFHNAMVRRQSFERWHTFFVRAVDNEGAADPSPDYRSFNSRTLAPRVELLPPIRRGEEFKAPPTVVFNWDGVDDEGDGTTLLPIASRYTVVPATKTVLQTYTGWPDTLYQLPRSAWSLWRAWGAQDGSGKRAILRNLQPFTDNRHVGFYIFAVQAMDEAGAVTPVFDEQTLGHNNAVRFRVSGDVGPRLDITDRYLGQFTFTSHARPQQVTVAAGQTVQFCWHGDAHEYGGSIVAYRYGWDLSNPNSDEEWEQGWSETATCAPARVFNSGTHTFFLETRDNAESITQGRIEMIVRRVTLGRDLLLVDDSAQPQGANDPAEGIEDSRWMAVIDSLRAERPFVFEPGRDIWDVRQRSNKEPPLEIVFDYKTIVWNVVGASNGSALRRLARLVDPFVQDPNATSTPFNYLNLYIENGGEMWITGQYPTLELVPIVGTRTPDRLVPDNITYWDQHETQHDSIGASSLAYRMGIEAVDIGNGSTVPSPPDSRGDAIDQGCIGFRRSGGPGGASPTYTSDRVLEHDHTLVIPGGDVELPPADGMTYVTSLSEGHTHSVTLTHDQLQSLWEGVSFEVTSGSADLPSPHVHHFVLSDPVGRWGAPAFLTPDSNFWPLPAPIYNPRGGRSGIEILQHARLHGGADAAAAAAERAGADAVRVREHLARRSRPVVPVSEDRRRAAGDHPRQIVDLRVAVHARVLRLRTLAAAPRVASQARQVRAPAPHAARLKRDALSRAPRPRRRREWHARPGAARRGPAGPDRACPAPLAVHR
jgi:hypothetical protein